MIRVTCAILERDKRVLVTQRKENTAQALLWEFPGGKLEPGETEEQCLTREVKEELNLQIEPVLRLTPVVHRYGEMEIELIPFVCRYISSTIELRAHRSYQWVLLADLLSYDWCEADVPIVEEYLQLNQQL